MKLRSMPDPEQQEQEIQERQQQNQQQQSSQQNISHLDAQFGNTNRLDVLLQGNQEVVEASQLPTSVENERQRLTPLFAQNGLLEVTHQISEPMRQENNIISENNSEEDVYNQRFINNYVNTSPVSTAMYNTSSGNTALMQRYSQLQNELQTLTEQMRQTQVSTNSGDLFNSVYISLSTLRNTLETQTNGLSRVQQQNLCERVSTLQRSLETYQEDTSNIFKILQNYSSQSQVSSEINSKMSSVLQQVNLTIQDGCQKLILEGLSEPQYSEFYNSLKNLRQEIYDTINNIRQKQYHFLTTSLLQANQQLQGSTVQPRVNNSPVTKVHNPLYEQQWNVSVPQTENQTFRNTEKRVPPFSNTLQSKVQQQPFQYNVQTQNTPVSQAKQPDNSVDDYQVQTRVPQPTLPTYMYSRPVRQSQQVQQSSGNTNTFANSTRQLPPPKFDKFSGESNASLWITRFERTSKRYKMTDEEMLDEVLNQMSKNAERWATRNQSHFKTYQDFKTMFLAKFLVPFEQFQQQLFSEKQGRNDTYQQFLDKLNSVAGQGDVEESTLKVLFLNNMYRQDVSLHLNRFLTDPTVDTVELCRQANFIQQHLDRISNQQKTTQGAKVQVQQQQRKPQYNQPRPQYQNNPVYNRPYTPTQGQSQNKPINPQSPKKPPYSPRNNNNNARIGFLDTGQVGNSPEPEQDSQVNQEPMVYDHEQSQLEYESVEQSEQVQQQSAPSLGCMVQLGKMLQVQPDTRVSKPKKFDPLCTIQETVKLPKEKQVQQRFSVESLFKNQNVNIKFEDLLLSSPAAFQEFKQYASRLEKVYNGEIQQDVSSKLALAKPAYVMNEGVCEVTVPNHKVSYFVKCKVEEIDTKCFIDTGAGTSCVSRSFLQKHNLGEVSKNSEEYTLVDGKKFTPEGTVSLKVKLDPHTSATVQAAVVDNDTFEFLMGTDLFEALSCYTLRAQLFYKNPFNQRYSSLVMYRMRCDDSLSFLGIFENKRKKFFKICRRVQSFLVFVFSTAFSLKTISEDFNKVDSQVNNQYKHFEQLYGIWRFLLGNNTFVQAQLFKIYKAVLLTHVLRKKQDKPVRPPSLGCMSFTQSSVTKQKEPTTTRTTKFQNFPRHNKYQLMIVDFPWKYQSDKYLVPTYQTLELDQLKCTPIGDIASDNCVFLFWATGPKLKDCISLVEHFGLQFITCFSVWRKMDKGKLYESKGAYTKPNYEYVLLASKGNIQQFKRHVNATVSQEISAQIKRHSEKPNQFYDVVSQVFKVEEMDCIELFARIQKHSYLDLYGNDIENYFTPSLKNLENKYVDESGITRLFHLQDVSVQTPLNEVVSKYFKKATSLPLAHIDLLTKPFEHTQLHFEQLLPILRILVKRLEAFAFEEHQVGTTHVLQHSIELEKDCNLKAQTPYRLTGPERDFVKAEIEHLEQLGYIVRDVSPHAAPIVVVKKENGKFRMCIDFRDLNKFTIPHHWPLPQIDVLLTYLYLMIIFSKFDLRSGFFNILLKLEDQYKTSFVCNFGQYRYTRMPFGLRNAPSTFQHAMEDILRTVLYKFCLVYIDDVIVFSRSVSEHYEHVRIVLDLIIQSGVKLHPEKCQIGVPEVEFLGHKVTYNRVYPKESKTAKVESMSPPQTVKQLQSFLGFTSYYRKFIKDYSKIAKPLQQLVQKEIKFEWLEPQQKSFETLKKVVTSQPHLKIPDLTARFYLCTDFSADGLGAVLSQIDETVQLEKPVEYASRTLNVHESKYGSYEGECLAVIWAFHKFRHYLLGKEFTLHTDNKALSWILSNKNPSPKIARWLLVIQEYNFVTLHRSGKSNSNADSLSRMAPQLCYFQKQPVPTLMSINSTVDQETVTDLCQYLTLNAITDTDSETYETLEPLYKPCDIGDLACEVCHSTEMEERMLLCESCGKGYHLECTTPPLQSVPDGDWYCSNCLTKFKDTPWQDLDITVDYNSVAILKGEKTFEKFSKEDQVILKNKTQDYTIVDDKIYKNYQDKQLRVPTIYERQQITEEYHEHLTSHSGVRRTIDLIQTKYYWPRMEKYVLNYIQHCIVCLASNKTAFKQHNDLYLTEKGQAPFQVWSCDLLTGLPRTSHGNTILLVMVCCFSKWVEAVPLSNKESSTVATAFYSNIIVRYGKPLQVRTDGGGEFEGSFEILLDKLGVQKVVTNPYYARSNGQAERMNRTLLYGMKKTIHTRGLPLNAWDDLLPHVLFTSRMCKNYSTDVPPFQAIFAKKPELMSPLDFAKDYNISETSKENIKQYMQRVAKVQTLLFPKIKQSLEKAEVDQQDQYRKKLRTFQESIEPGQLVFKNVGSRTTKLQMTATGPYAFKRYTNQSKTSCDIQEIESQKIYTVSTANIVPIPQI